ncbi:hypothetical protein CF326_g5678, partial [Tilletia indica]
SSPAYRSHARFSNFFRCAIDRSSVLYLLQAESKIFAPLSSALTLPASLSLSFCVAALLLPVNFSS